MLADPAAPFLEGEGVGVVVGFFGFFEEGLDDAFGVVEVGEFEGHALHEPSGEVVFFEGGADFEGLLEAFLSAFGAALSGVQDALQDGVKALEEREGVEAFGEFDVSFELGDEVRDGVFAFDVVEPEHGFGVVEEEGITVLVEEFGVDDLLDGFFEEFDGFVEFSLEEEGAGEQLACEALVCGQLDTCAFFEEGLGEGLCVGQLVVHEHDEGEAGVGADAQAGVMEFFGEVEGVLEVLLGFLPLSEEVATPAPLDECFAEEEAVAELVCDLYA